MTEISEEVKTGKEVLIDYLTCTFEFYFLDEEKELENKTKDVTLKIKGATVNSYSFGTY